MPTSHWTSRAIAPAASTSRCARPHSRGGAKAEGFRKKTQGKGTISGSPSRLGSMVRSQHSRSGTLPAFFGFHLGDDAYDLDAGILDDLNDVHDLPVFEFLVRLKI